MYAYIADTVNALSPDLTAVTGDLVDGSVARLRDEVAPLAELRARDGVYFVTGNHDHYSGARDWVQEVSDLGMRVLFNSHEVIQRGDAAFTLAGVNDHTSGQHSGDSEDVPAAFAGRDPSLPTILLATSSAYAIYAFSMLRTASPESIKKEPGLTLMRSLWRPCIV